MPRPECKGCLVVVRTSTTIKMHKRHSSATVSEHPVWNALAPRYQSLLTTPQSLKVFLPASAARGFEAGTVSVPPCDPTKLLVTGHPSCSLSEAKLAVGYAALHELSNHTQATVNPRLCIGIHSTEQPVFLQFACESTCEDWGKALDKLLAAVNPHRCQDRLGHLFDITVMPGRSENWR